LSSNYKPQTGRAAALINASFPAYYTQGCVLNVAIHVSNSIGPMDPADPSCFEGVMAVDGSAFTATASGVIAPNELPSSMLIDVWTMNERRELSHAVDGVK